MRNVPCQIRFSLARSSIRDPGPDRNLPRIRSGVGIGDWHGTWSNIPLVTKFPPIVTWRSWRVPLEQFLASASQSKMFAKLRSCGAIRTAVVSHCSVIAAA